MEILPVLDLLDGVVVRGIAGRRSEYRPLISNLTSSNNPLDVAHSIRHAFGLNHLYVADLDGILRGHANLTLFERLIGDGFELMIDAGVRDVASASELRVAGMNRLIVGLESCRSPQDLARLIEFNPGVIFSLDLQNGRPMLRQDASGWRDQPSDIAAAAIEAGCTQMIVLDLADVGTSTGGSTDQLCGFIRHSSPQVKIISGGGVRDVDDLKRFEQLGLDAVLVASALHDGQLARADIDSIRLPSPQ